MITLSSDFGSPYPAAMRGVLLDSCTAQCVDIAHDFERGNIRTTAFWLREILPYFPPAIHLIVIDPGVGTDRSVLVVRAGEHAFVGHDNGVMYPAIEAIDTEWEAFELTEYSSASSTFHGRDVFAPLAAQVANSGVAHIQDLSHLEPVDEITAVTFPQPSISANTIEATVLAIDDFGNVITNVPEEVTRTRVESAIEIEGNRIPFVHTYAFVPTGSPLATIGSHGNLELACNGDRGDTYFDVTEGDELRIGV